ncbi:SatD family protein [Acetonema longum]|uniref:SatD family (SatD) n=1 Tax=Acetonema longum DSM 6540 TaxID=1009370 RepID=F7NG52_9FIRM|nr:SatD family protein [Acetonema longum]EGO64970.1 hypothetical protein ALO_05193 [Acetonema longum DSM 6540]
MLYCAIIGDIVGSRKLADRSEVQKKFQAVAERACRQYQADIASPFTVTIGDEFQVLLKRVQTAPEVIKTVIREMAPIDLVFGVGIGDISTDINREMAIGMDGPAFHAARKAVEQAKRKKPGVIYRTALPEVGAGTDMINSLQYFIESCSKKRTKRQKQVLELLEKGSTQEEIAEHLDIKQQSVSNIVNWSYMPEITGAQKAIASYLEWIDHYRH